MEVCRKKVVSNFAQWSLRSTKMLTVSKQLYILKSCPASVSHCLLPIFSTQICKLSTCQHDGMISDRYSLILKTKTHLWPILTAWAKENLRKSYEEVTISQNNTIRKIAEVALLLVPSGRLWHKPGTNKYSCCSREEKCCYCVISRCRTWPLHTGSQVWSIIGEELYIAEELYYLQH